MVAIRHHRVTRLADNPNPANTGGICVHFLRAIRPDQVD